MKKAIPEPRASLKPTAQATTVAVAQARKKKIQIILQLVPSPEVAGLFFFEKHPAGKPLSGAKLGPPLETVKREHVCLVLHTSGTTKKPKIVPITHESMAIGGLCHAAANLLGPEDVFVNTMPMFHIAGVMENLLMSAYSGCKFIALPGQYQAHTFFEAMKKEPLPTSYSAVPAHHMSLMTLAKEAKNFESPLKVIRNDSAALLPSLAEQMEDFFQATVLPAYSMTEANPLCSNPRYGVRKLKSVGPAVGPELAVMEAWPSDKRVGVDAYDIPFSGSLSGSVVAFNVAIASSGAFHRWQRAFNVAKEMENLQVLPTVVTFNGLISCVEGWVLATHLLEQLEQIPMEPDVISYSSAINVCDWLRGLHLLRRTPDPNEFCFSSVVKALGKDWCRGLQLLAEQSFACLVPNAVNYGSLLARSPWRPAMEVCRRMVMEAVRANVITCGSLISCEKGWRSAFEVLNFMEQNFLRKNLICYNSAISACESSEIWRPAVEMLRSMSSPNIISFSSSISACQTWPMAMQLCMLAGTYSLRSNVVALSSMISAFEKARRWSLAIQQLHATEAPNLTCFNAALAACKDASWLMVLEIWREMRPMQAPVWAPSLPVALGTLGLRVSSTSLCTPSGVRGAKKRVGEEGEVCVKGACVMKGYEMRPHMDKDPNAEAFTDGFMRSGDKGWIDEDGYLYLIGRFKELINRAGEKISPFEVEDAIRRHADVQDVLCFSCPHSMLGEAVGVVVVPKDGKTVKLFDLRQWLMKEKVLQDKWCPEVLVTMKELPKGATGKPARVNLAKKLELEQLDGNLKEFSHPGF
ncbi:unnamed protein product [Cladocopium goreaui]|uniref:Oxalate--CoA ligase (Oxalyl-CoA synthetase ) (Peroxisomal-coenzyme A synthetase) n=1 Tax=Cladocopium goreaui TaxID=2562237 RepID=A0A9P1CBI1_9DINO|nr:unnamed protein product [Cladocopium goreaui]